MTEMEKLFEKMLNMEMTKEEMYGQCRNVAHEPMTNEEWLKGLSTEEKADALTHKIMDIICWNNDPKPSEVYITIKNWLKREHNDN